MARETLLVVFAFILFRRRRTLKLQNNLGNFRSFFFFHGSSFILRFLSFCRVRQGHFRTVFERSSSISSWTSTSPSTNKIPPWSRRIENCARESLSSIVLRRSDGFFVMSFFCRLSTLVCTLHNRNITTWRKDEFLSLCRYVVIMS